MSEVEEQTKVTVGSKWRARGERPGKTVSVVDVREREAGYPYVEWFASKDDRGAMPIEFFLRDHEQL